MRSAQIERAKDGEVTVAGAEIPLAVAGAALFNAVVVGMAWGNLNAGQGQLKKDMHNVKAALGLENGASTAEPTFVRRTELALLVKRADEEHARYEENDKDFEERIRALEAE